MRTRPQLGAICALCFQLTACIGPTGAMLKTTINGDPQQTSLVGKTKAEVIAQYGDTRNIHFDNGYEVWVYKSNGDGSGSINLRKTLDFVLRGKGTLGKNEFIVLFNPSGVVTKTRVRTEPADPAA